MANIEDLKNVVLKDIQVIDMKKIIFTCQCGSQWKMYHDRECCEDVSIEDITGDLKDLLNTPIINVYEATSHSSLKPSIDHITCTWTFYVLSTIKGSVTIRWYGASNGYYSEKVDFEKIN